MSDRKGCVCIFEGPHTPVQECSHHAAVRAELERLRAEVWRLRRQITEMGGFKFEPEADTQAAPPRGCDHQWRHDVQQLTTKPNNCLLCGMEKGGKHSKADCRDPDCPVHTVGQDKYQGPESEKGTANCEDTWHTGEVSTEHCPQCRGTWKT